MKTLHIVRHGKSSWDLPGISDIDRPLIEKGIVNNYLMAESLKVKYAKPEIIFCSPANRTIHTAIIMSRVMKVSFNALVIKNELYESSVSTVLEIIGECKSGINSLMIIGHNPVFTELANLFLSENISNLPTSGIVTLQFELNNWKISDKPPVSSGIIFPKKD